MAGVDHVPQPSPRLSIFTVNCDTLTCEQSRHSVCVTITTEEIPGPSSAGCTSRARRRHMTDYVCADERFRGAVLLLLLWVQEHLGLRMGSTEVWARGRGGRRKECFVRRAWLRLWEAGNTPDVRLLFIRPCFLRLPVPPRHTIRQVSASGLRTASRYPRSTTWLLKWVEEPWTRRTSTSPRSPSLRTRQG
ncbi:hypothetical protein GALMADRAFT_232347 [Galerina marginata CBS 339.88]|uniref:Uncharacterized protein n=1 Tax=Galerina marginata (strain CBS 339.88) TaxID=685588 RepID=A0A067SG42_GALM3|nr:hypothetical protein GALMADRAFT_232347 [Galerina marginata CBS 339.88]